MRADAAARKARTSTHVDTMGACLRKPPQPVVLEEADAPAVPLATDDPTKPPNALHVRIIRARGLPAVDTNLLTKNSSDPYVRIECCGERARTSTKKQQLDPDYGEAFVLNRDEDEPLILQVIDADVLSSDDLMCSCSIKIESRHPQKAWYDLVDAQGTQAGRVQVATHLVHDADHWAPTLPATDDSKRRKNELCVVLRRAKNLRVADRSIIGPGSSDPFVVIRCDGASVSSRVVSKNLNPVFDDLLTLRVEDAAAPIVIEVRDKDLKGSDVLGVVELGAVGGLDGALTWYPLSPSRGAAPDQVLGAVRLALSWRFSDALAPAWVEREETRDRSLKLNELAVFLRGATGSVIGDPLSNKGVFAVLKCDGASGRTKHKNWDKDGRWNEEVRLHVEDDHTELLVEVRDQGLVSSSLLGSLILEHSPEEVSFGERILESSSLRVQLCVSWRHNPDLSFAIEEDATIEAFDGRRGEPPNQLVVRVIRAKEVKAMDWALFTAPKSDPVVRLTLGVETNSTRVLRNTLDPEWDERFTFACKDANIVLQLLVQDEDRFLLGAVKSHDFLGKVEIRVGDLKRGPARYWFPLLQKDKAGVMDRLAGATRIQERGSLEVFLDWRFDKPMPIAADGRIHALDESRPIVQDVLKKASSGAPKPKEDEWWLREKQSVFAVASLRGVPNTLECQLIRAEIRADPQDLLTFDGASRDAYCRLSAGEERFERPSEPGGKRRKAFVLTGDVWQSSTIKRSLVPQWSEQTALRLDSAPKAALTVQVFDDTCALDDEHDHLVGSHTLLLKDVLGVAKDGRDAVEAWVPLKAPDAGAGQRVDGELVAAVKASPTKMPRRKTPRKKRPALHVLTSGLVVTKRRAKKLAHPPFSATTEQARPKSSVGDLARDLARAKGASASMRRLQSARVSPARRGEKCGVAFAAAEPEPLQSSGPKVGDGRVLLALKWIFDPRLNPRELGLVEEAEWARKLGVSGEPPTGAEARARWKALAAQAPPNMLKVTVVRAARVRAPPSLAKEGGFTLLAEVRVAHRLMLQTDVVAAPGGSSPDEVPEVVWKATGRKQIREREVSPKALLEVSVLAVDAKGQRHVVGKSVAAMAQYRDGYPRRAWLKLGDRVTGTVDAWRGAVDVFVVWVHEESEAWDAEVSQVKAKEAAKVWKEANLTDRSHITTALSLLEGSIASAKPTKKVQVRRSTSDVAEALFDDASHATTHTYLPDGLPATVEETARQNNLAAAQKAGDGDAETDLLDAILDDDTTVGAADDGSAARHPLTFFPGPGSP